MNGKFLAGGADDKVQATGRYQRQSLSGFHYSIVRLLKNRQGRSDIPLPIFAMRLKWSKKVDSSTRSPAG